MEILNDILYFSLICVLVVSFLAFFSKGKELSPKRKRFLKVISLAVVLFFLIYVIVLNIGLNLYYKDQIRKEDIAYRSLLVQYQSLLTRNKQQATVNNTFANKIKITDSLKKYIGKLTLIIAEIKQYKYIPGADKSDVDSADETLARANRDILTLESYIKGIKDVYNKKLNVKDILINCKGFKISGNTSDFQFDCPKDLTSNYIDLTLKFYNDSLIKQIACIYLRVDKDTIRSDQTKYLKDTLDRLFPFVFEQAYKPQYGINKFRILNYAKQSNVLLTVGYVLNNQKKSSYPFFEKVSCRF